jgi:DNA-binding NtrC family response regulator
MKLLVVEDDEAQLSWLEANLADRGHCVRVASDGDTALARWNKYSPFDVVITDYRFPGETIRSGLDLIAAVRSIDPLQAFVIQTSERNLAAPFGVRLIHKPYRFHRLLKLLKTPTQPSLNLQPY